MGLGVRWKPLIGFMLLGSLVLLLTRPDTAMLPGLLDAHPSHSPDEFSATAAVEWPAAPSMGNASVSATASCAAPCQHGGVCVMRLCRCPRGYEGSACQTRLPAPPAECGPLTSSGKAAQLSDKRACKPSFLIIGAGKSGTSSLYYYLAAHPAVHPAVQKQLQFFDHGYPEGHVSGTALRSAMETYFSRGFPASMPDGHITGEASPGYMVYSEVPERIKSQLPAVRILAVVRDPVTRAFSSYKYNYLRNLPPGALPIPFGVMVRWEIDRVINPCLAKHGYKDGGRLPVIDITRDCYDAFPIKVQYKEVRDRSNPAYTEEQLPQRQRFVYKGMVGRGLYALMMQHYYRSFSPHQIKLICTEALSTPASAAAQMREVGEWLGLRPGLDEPGHYDFADAVAVGKYNTGDNTGYEKTTPWGNDAASSGEGDEVEPDQAHHPKAPALGHNAELISLAKIDEGSERMLRGFFKPFNDQLFAMANRHKCEGWLSNTF